MEAARACEYAWISHGHPDHLSADSLALLKSKRILLPDHRGGRIRGDLEALGYGVRVLPDREWVSLSPRIRVLCIPDYNQDAILLVDLDGTLVVDLNDASDRGWGGFVRKTVRGFRRSFLLALTGYGDADMIHYKTESGERVTPYAAVRSPVGLKIKTLVEQYGTTHFVPFSSMHKYQRKDSIWASKYTTNLDDYARGFHSSTVTLTPAFIRYDCVRDEITPLQPRENRIDPVDPARFGDDWGEPLEPREFHEVESYFRRFEHLASSFDFITFRVGGREHRIELAQRRFRKGITFEVPSSSLMTAIRYEIFDDLLIGNFMSTTLHGDFKGENLYPDFTPWVAKYGDNGHARTRAELAAYFRDYRARDPLGYLRHRLDARCLRPLQQGSSDFLRERVGADSAIFRGAKRAYWGVRRAMWRRPREVSAPGLARAAIVPTKPGRNVLVQGGALGAARQALLPSGRAGKNVPSFPGSAPSEAADPVRGR